MIVICMLYSVCLQWNFNEVSKYVTLDIFSLFSEFKNHKSFSVYRRHQVDCYYQCSLFYLHQGMKMQYVCLGALFTVSLDSEIIMCVYKHRIVLWHVEQLQLWKSEKF